MKVFLIYSLDKLYFKMSCPGLGLAYLAACAIKNGDTVKFIDRNILFLKNKGGISAADKITVDELKRFKPDIVIFSSNVPVMTDVKYFSSVIKEIMPSLKIVIADPYPYSHYSFEPEENLKNCPTVDIAIRGEGEQTVINIISNLNKLSDVKGISFRDRDKIISNEEASPIVNLDDIPMPRRDLLDMNFYSAADFEAGFYGRGISIYSSRGCYNDCNYCLSYRLSPGVKVRMRFHSAGRVIAEIEDILSLCKVGCLYFYDDDFLCNKARVIDLCENMIRAKINKRVKWIAQTRAEKSRMDESTLRLMKKAGCIQLEFGFESGSQEELDRMNKRITLKDYFETVEIVKKSGIRIQSDFLMGYPGQTADDFKKTIAFIKKIKPDHVTSQRYMTLPGTQTYETLKNKGFKRQFGDLSQNCNFTAMSDKDFAKMLDTILIPLKIKTNRKNFIIYYLLNNPILLFYLVFRKILAFILGTIGFCTKEWPDKSRLKNLLLSEN